VTVDPQTEADICAIELAAAQAHQTGYALDALAAEMRLRAIRARQAERATS
jgi:hypothetical protein